MAYSIDIKEKAFAFYCQGYSFDRIRQIMLEDGTRITKRTLINWEKHYGWRVRRRNIQKKAREKIDKEQATEIANLNAQLAELQNDLLEELKNVQLKSKEGGVTALRQLHDMRQRLFSDKRFEENIDEIITVVFEILASDEVIGPRLQNRQEIIIGKLEKILREKYGIK